MKSPIFDSFNQDRSRSGKTDLCINLYPEQIQGEKGQEIGLLVNCPGLSAPLVTCGTGPIRGVYRASNNMMYVASGSELYAVNSSWSPTLIGNINPGSTSVKMIDNTTQLLAVDGIGGWVVNKASNSISLAIPNADTDAQSPMSACYQDGFGLVNSNDNEIYQSNYNDLSSFATVNGGNLGSTANNAFVQGNPQDVVAMFDLKREVWIFKKDAAEVWINNGNAGFAFVQLQGVYVTAGCSAPASVAKIGDHLIWLGENEEGMSVFMSVGYEAKPILTHSLTALFQSFSTVSDAIAYTYQSANHYFYVITFPSENVTYAWDMTTGKWHQRASFLNGSFNREIANCHCRFNGKHVVGDYQNGNLYELSDTSYTDNSVPRKWLRTWRALPSGMPYGMQISFDQLQILMQTGVSVPSGTNPTIMLRWSDDGGLTWNGERQIPAGKIGETAWRVLDTRLGSATLENGLDRVWEISCADPIAVLINGAEWEGGAA